MAAKGVHSCRQHFKFVQSYSSFVWERCVHGAFQTPQQAMLGASYASCSVMVGVGNLSFWPWRIQLQYLLAHFAQAAAKQILQVLVLWVVMHHRRS